MQKAAEEQAAATQRQAAAEEQGRRMEGGSSLMQGAVAMAQQVGAMPEGEVKEAMKLVVQQQIQNGAQMMGGSGNTEGGSGENAAG
jgi:hypothetical protein